MITSGITGSSTTDALTSTAANGTTQAGSRNNLASEETFLKLFVAQLQNQDPLSPNQQDPTQMVSELAQFSQLEQMVNIGSDVHSISQGIAGAPSSASTSSQMQSNSNAGATGAA
jgi:flagellar basal-body rod modification protein FlgD